MKHIVFLLMPCYDNNILFARLLETYRPFYFHKMSICHTYITKEGSPMYSCPNCGSQMTFDPTRQALYCSHCDTTVQPQSQATDEQKATTYQTHVFSCSHCGAEILSTDDTIATFCSYCGSSILLESRIEEQDRPDYVIPFQLTKEDCEAAYRKLLRRAPFVPDEMKNDAQIQRFRGIYMPYWIYSFEKDGHYSVSGHRSRRRGDYVYTKHYQLQSEMQAQCSGLSYDASSKFADNLSASIAPFDADMCAPFSPEYLSGFYADRGDVHDSVYRSDASELAGNFIADQVSKDHTYRRYNVSRSSLSANFRPKHSQAQLGMFPVWFLGCRSHDGQHISYAVINGQTGKVAADLPIDMRKYLLGSLLLAIPLFFLLNLFLTLTPTKALVAAILLAFLSLLVSNHQLNRIYTRDLMLDDKGLQSVPHPRPHSPETKQSPTKKKRSVSAFSRGSSVVTSILRVVGIMVLMWISVPLLAILATSGIFRSGFSIILLMLLWFGFMVYLMMNMVKRPNRSHRKGSVYAAPMSDKWKSLSKPLSAIAIALVILLWNPVSDLYYYLGASLSLGCVIWSFFDIIREHNQLTMRKLPQLDQRGGDIHG